MPVGGQYTLLNNSVHAMTKATWLVGHSTGETDSCYKTQCDLTVVLQILYVTITKLKSWTCLYCVGVFVLDYF